MDESMVRSLGYGSFLGWEEVNVVGAVEGVLVVGDRRRLELLEKEVELFTVSCKFKLIEDGFTWVFMGGVWARFQGRKS